MIFIPFYFIVILILAKERSSTVPNYFLRFFLAVLFILLVGLRGEYVGVDTPNYYSHYYIFGPDGCDFVEVGFDWINRFCYHHGWGVGSFFTICAAVTILPVVTVLNKLSNKEYSLAALLFYGISFATLCNGMRQGMAAGIFLLLGYTLCDEDNQNRKYYLIYSLGVLFASLFHTSALLLIVFPLLVKIPLSKRICTIIYVLSFAFVFFDFSDFIPNISSILSGPNNYSRYDDLQFTESTSWFGFAVSSIAYIIIIILMYASDSYKEYPLLSLFVLIACILKNMAFGIPIIGRMSMYFEWFIYILLAKLHYEQRALAKYPPVWILLFSIYLAVGINAIISSQNKILPYQFNWEWPIER